MGALFGTNGVRGITNSELTPELALGLGKAIGTFYKAGSRIMVGRDIRAGGDMIVRALTSGLLSSGVQVDYAGVLPTPALQYGIRKRQYDGGVMVTASHNPAEFNGIKVLGPDGVEAEAHVEEAIEKYYFSRKFREAKWQDLNRDVAMAPGVIDEYIKEILSKVDAKRIRKRGFKVLIDGGNSVGSLASVRVAKELGCEVHEVATDLDPLFPSRPPEPTHASLEKSAALVKRFGADIGVAHDGDADRAVFIDSQGRVQFGDRSGTLLAYWCSKKSGKAKNTVITPFSSSNLVEDFLGREGIKVKWTRIGSIHVSKAMLESGAIAGFEDNGGFAYPKHQRVRDGAMTFALMLDFLASQDKSSAELFDMLPKYQTEKIKIPLTKGMDVGKILRKVKSKYKGVGKVVDTDNDGLKMVADGFWFIVRKSGTEPVLRISVEAKSRSVLYDTMRELKKLI